MHWVVWVLIGALITLGVSLALSGGLALSEGMTDGTFEDTTGATSWNGWEYTGEYAHITCTELGEMSDTQRNRVIRAARDYYRADHAGIYPTPFDKVVHDACDALGWDAYMSAVFEYASAS